MLLWAPSRNVGVPVCLCVQVMAKLMAYMSHANPKSKRASQMFKFLESTLEEVRVHAPGRRCSSPECVCVCVFLQCLFVPVFVCVSLSDSVGGDAGDGRLHFPVGAV